MSSTILKLSLRVVVAPRRWTPGRVTKIFAGRVANRISVARLDLPLLALDPATIGS
jgi:hypothetical protein